MGYRPTSPPNSKRQTLLPKEAPPAEWLVWRAFHDSLEFYEKELPHATADLLSDRLAMTGPQISAFMNGGRGYLRRLDEIDDEARADIFSRYGERLAPQGLPPSAPNPEQLLLPGARHPDRRLLPGTASDGRSILEMIQADGFIAEIEARRSAALEAHLETLRQSLGNETLLKLERWITVEVAPGVAASASEVAPAVRDPAPRQ